MKFSDAYIEMLKGRRMTRPCFNGYWYVNGKTGKLVIHLENGDEITEGDLTLTTQNTIAEDWDYYYEPLGSLSKCSCEEEKCCCEGNWADCDCEGCDEPSESYVDYTDGIGDEFVYCGGYKYMVPTGSEVTEKFESAVAEE